MESFDSTRKILESLAQPEWNVPMTVNEMRALPEVSQTIQQCTHALILAIGMLSETIAQSKHPEVEPEFTYEDFIRVAEDFCPIQEESDKK